MSKSDIHAIVLWTQIFGILAIIIAGIVIGLILIDFFDTKNTSIDDIGKINRDFRKHIEKKLLKMERRNKIKAGIKSRIIAIVSKIKG